MCNEYSLQVPIYTAQLVAADFCIPMYAAADRFLRALVSLPIRLARNIVYLRYQYVFFCPFLSLLLPLAICSKGIAF